ncbi:MAG: hypothetical protein ACI9MR_002483, partial [Myxococcota bacterium]
MLRWLSIVFSGALLFGLLACDPAAMPGQVSAAFEFVDAPDASANYWVFARVTADAGTTTLSAQAPVEWSVGESLAFRFEGIDNGAGREVRVEFRRSADPAQPMELFGVSAPYELRPGVTTAVTVRVQIRVPNTLVGNSLAIVTGDAVEDGLADPRLLGTVSLVATTVAGRVIEVSNDPDLRNLWVIDLAAPPAGVTCATALVAGETATRCIIRPWNLLDPDPTPPGGAFTVYAIFRDDEGYPSSPEVARVIGDIDPPVLLAAAVTTAVRNGDIAALTITVSEATEPPTLTMRPEVTDDAWRFNLQPSLDKRTWRWVSTPTDAVPPAVADLELFRFAVGLVDLRGNAALAEQIPLVGAIGAPLEMVIDLEAPQPSGTGMVELSNGETVALAVANNLARVNDRVVLHVTGEVSDAGGIAFFEAALGGMPLPCESANTD